MARLEKPTLVFAHGWGFHSGLWRDLTRLLSDFDHVYVDLGFIWEGPKGSSSLPQNAVCIGHSFGLLWLLKHGPKPMRGLVSIAGFDCYHADGSTDHIEAMKRGLDRNAGAQMQAFLRACGIDTFAETADFDVAGMRGALDWIATWDQREARNALKCPVMALASTDDPIVPKAMSETIWGKGDLRLRADGSHALPLTQPVWCADEIRNFVAGIAD